MMDVPLGPSSSQSGLYSLGPSTAANGRAQANIMPPAPAADGIHTHIPFVPVTAHSTSAIDHQHVAGTRKMRKRKAETQDNERLAKRLSLLNIGGFFLHHSLLGLVQLRVIY
jgi:hypothetical protein